MAGNLQEWCWDFHGNRLGLPSLMDPTGPDGVSARVVRGGDWGNSARDCRVDNRIGSRYLKGTFHGYENQRFYSVGFRTVRR